MPKVPVAIPRNNLAHAHLADKVLMKQIKEYLQAEINSLKQRVDQLEKETSPHRMAGYD